MKNSTQREFCPRTRPFWLLVLLLMPGCRAQMYLGNSQQQWMWAVIPLLGFPLVGGFLVQLYRRHQLRRWRVDRGEPPVQRIYFLVAIVAVVVMLGFGVVNWRLRIYPRQQFLNDGLWLIGTLIGALVALLLGLRIAERN